MQVEPHTEGLQQFSVRVKDSLASSSAPGLAKPQNAELRSNFGADGAVSPRADMLCSSVWPSATDGGLQEQIEAGMHKLICNKPSGHETMLVVSTVTAQPLLRQLCSPYMYSA